MLKQFAVTNYRNFKEKVEIDFSKVGGYQFNTECILNQNINKMLIYGRNATGKTNLGLAILDIKEQYTLIGKRGVYLNADSKEKKAMFQYVFQFENDKLIYNYSKISESELYEEELIVNGNRVFYFNFDKIEIDISGLNILEVDTINIQKYIEVISEDNESPEDGLQQLTFLRFLIFNTALKKILCYHS